MGNAVRDVRRKIDLSFLLFVKYESYQNQN